VTTNNISDAVVLSVAGKDYPIKLCEKYTNAHFARGPFQRIATVTASTKQKDAVVTGQRGAPVAHVASLKCTPLDPVDAETRARTVTQQGVRLLQTFVDLYPLDQTNGYARLVVEDLQNE
jgi:hypothetical protein